MYGKELINQAYDQITTLLMSGWLAVDDDNEGQYLSCTLKEFIVVAD